jgi:outer membrane protein assembly factor BamB
VIDLPQGGEVLSAPASWVNPIDGSTWIFIANHRGLSALKSTSERDGTPRLKEVWRATIGGTSPLLANGVLFCASSGNIRALDPLTGKALWEDSGIGGIHWESPIVVNGVVYITDEIGSLHAYSLKGAPPG